MSERIESIKLSKWLDNDIPHSFSDRDELIEIIETNISQINITEEGTIYKLKFNSGVSNRYSSFQIDELDNSCICSSKEKCLEYIKNLYEKFINNQRYYELFFNLFNQQ